MAMSTLSKAFHRAEQKIRTTHRTDAETLAFNEYGVSPGEEVFFWRWKPQSTQDQAYRSLIPDYDGSPAAKKKLRRKLSRMTREQIFKLNRSPTLAVIVSIDNAYWNQSGSVTVRLTVAPMLPDGLGKTRSAWLTGDLGSGLTNVSRR